MATKNRITTALLIAVSTVAILTIGFTSVASAQLAQRQIAHAQFCRDMQYLYEATLDDATEAWLRGDYALAKQYQAEAERLRQDTQKAGNCSWTYAVRLVSASGSVSTTTVTAMR
jgi:hypothetical protein